MRIGIPRESRPGETRVAATAKTAAQLTALGYDVVVEAGAGAAADQACWPRPAVPSWSSGSAPPA